MSKEAASPSRKPVTWKSAILFSLAVVFVLLVPGLLLAQYRSGLAYQKEQEHKYESFSKNHGITIDVTRELDRVETLAGAGKLEEAWTGLQPLLASSNAGTRYEAYRSLATLWRYPSLRERVHAKIESASTDEDARIRNSYALLLVLSAAPNALARAEEFAKRGDSEQRRITQEAITWARQNGVGAGREGG